MVLSPETNRDIRLPRWLLLPSLLVVTPVIYLISELRFHPVTLGEHVFLWCGAALGTILYGTTFSCREQMNQRLPRLFRAVWARFILCVVATVSLDLLIHTLRLRPFYEKTSDFLVIITLAPFVFNSRTQARASRFFGTTSISPRKRLLLASSLSGDEEIILPIDRSRPIFLLIVSFALIAASVLVLPKGPALGWLGISFFGSSALLAGTMMIPGCSCLILRRNDFVLVNLWRHMPIQWQDASDFIVVNTPQGPRVGWNLSCAGSAGMRGARFVSKTRKWMTETYGRNAMLSHEYGVTPEELCQFMAERMRRAQAVDADRDGKGAA